MRVFCFLILWWISADGLGQTIVTWSDLSAGISWELATPQGNFPGFQTPNFSPQIKVLEGEKVILTGYLLVLGGNRSVYLLSKNPMASCFFCGNGGPETVVDLTFAEEPSYKMDELLSVEGVFYLNEDNPNASYYRIENAEASSFN